MTRARRLLRDAAEVAAIFGLVFTFLVALSGRA